MPTDSPKAEPLKHRRGFQFSLRDLLALVALAALACAIAFPMIRRWQRIRAIQEKANEELKAMVKPVENAPERLTLTPIAFAACRQSETPAIGSGGGIPRAVSLR
jgi:hypothetical protein